MKKNDNLEFDIEEFIESKKFSYAITNDFNYFQSTLGSHNQYSLHKKQIILLIQKQISQSVIAYQNLSDVQEFHDIPFINKNSIRNDPSSFINNRLDFHELWQKNTSGTTGTPVTIFYSQEFHFAQLINTVRKIAYRAQMSEVDRSRILCLSITDNRSSKDLVVVDPTKETGPRIQIVVNESNPKSIERLFFLINKLQPAIITGKPSVFEILTSQSSLWHDRKDYVPRLIVSSGALLEEDLKKKTQEFFKANIFNSYGLTEFGLVASECQNHNGLHVDESRILAEITNDECVSTEEGELVLSCVDNTAMPLIRYKTGDLVTVDNTRCHCGTSGVRLTRIKGRRVTCFRFENGILFSPSHLNDLFNIFPISEFQITQLNLKNFEILVQPKSTHDTDNLIRKIRSYIKNTFPSEVEVSVRPTIFDYSIKFERYRSLI